MDLIPATFEIIKSAVRSSFRHFVVAAAAACMLGTVASIDDASPAMEFMKLREIIGQMIYEGQRSRLAGSDVR